MNGHGAEGRSTRKDGRDLPHVGHMLTVSYAYSIRRTTGNVPYGQALPADSPTQYLQMTSMWDPLIGTENDELKHSRRTSSITGFMQGNLSKKSINVTYSTAGWKQRNEHRDHRHPHRVKDGDIFQRPDLLRSTSNGRYFCCTGSHECKRHPSAAGPGTGHHLGIHFSELNSIL